MRHTVLLVIALCATAICAETKHAQTTSAQAAFKKMMTLEGKWEGKDADGNPVHTSFKAVISGTAVMTCRVIVFPVPVAPATKP